MSQNLSSAEVLICAIRANATKFLPIALAGVEPGFLERGFIYI